MKEECRHNKNKNYIYSASRDVWICQICGFEESALERMMYIDAVIKQSYGLKIYLDYLNHV